MIKNAPNPTMTVTILVQWISFAIPRYTDFWPVKMHMTQFPPRFVRPQGFSKMLYRGACSNLVYHWELISISARATAASKVSKKSWPRKGNSNLSLQQCKLSQPPPYRTAVIPSHFRADTCWRTTKFMNTLDQPIQCSPRINRLCHATFGISVMR